MKHKMTTLDMYQIERLKEAKMTEIVVEGVDPKDAPDFVDAYVESCLLDGRMANDDELDYINDNMPWVAQELAFEKYL